MPNRIYFRLAAMLVLAFPVVLFGEPENLRAAPAAADRSKVIKDIPYPGAGAGERRRSLDLYLPKTSKHKPPLLIFVHGGFWMLTDDDYRIGETLAKNLVQEGIAVALLRYRIAPRDPHPAQVEDVAAGVSLLVRDAKRYGYDAGRIFVAGHSAGGHLAALVGLDSQYLAKRLIEPSALAGVILFSGLYDLAPRWAVSDNQRIATAKTFGDNPRLIKNASPVSHVHGGEPPFLILSAAEDIPGFSIDARKFADALRDAGNEEVQQYQVKGADHFSLVKLEPEDNPIRRAVLAFMGVMPLPPGLADWAEAKQKWADPPYSTKSFWKHSALVHVHPVDERFLRMLLFVYQNRKEELLEWPLKEFHAIDLFAYLEALPKEQLGDGEYLVLSNIRGERQVWHRKEVEPYRPVIVVGLGDERNLFRLSTFYRMQREYSWKPGAPPPIMALSAGAFVYFLKDPPRALHPQSWHYGLTESSFQLVKEDPLKIIRDLPKDVQEALTFGNGCVYCHQFRGIGARSHHVEGRTGKAHGGFALPLESYPPRVWKAFMFDQEAVARMMGATPNILTDSAKAALFQLVNQSREAGRQ